MRMSSWDNGARDEASFPERAIGFGTSRVDDERRMLAARARIRAALIFRDKRGK
jgi:hypothetical protein